MKDEEQMGIIGTFRWIMLHVSTYYVVKHIHPYKYIHVEPDHFQSGDYGPVKV